MKYVFGPVNSRRLGISLGIDIIPFKLCSFNCVYCECGATTKLTSEIREYVPAEEVIKEIDSVLADAPALDVITFSGSGEPTLNSGIGKIINHLKNSYPQYKVAVLTNSTTMRQDDVRRRVTRADMIYPSLDAASDEVFERIMRPAPGVYPADIIEGLVSLRHEFKGKICLEIFIIERINDTLSELNLLKDACVKISPDEIHLNSLDRRGTEPWVRPVSPERMQEIQRFFEPLPARVVSRSKAPSYACGVTSSIDTLLLLELTSEAVEAQNIADKMGERVVDVLRAAERLAKKGEAGIIPGDNPGIFRIIK